MRRSVDKVVEAAKDAAAVGVGAICVFPYTGLEERTEECAGAWDPDNHANRAIRAIKAALPDMVVMTDVALDTYNINGHDGFVENGEIVNDRTVEALVKMALSQAGAGADIIGPSDMMDGRILTIREALEDEGFINTGIMSYSAKYASAFYGPFRDALDSAPVDMIDIPKDKKTYQMDYANRFEAIKETEMDIDEGADIVMVKPGLCYLDIVREIKNAVDVPVAVYQVSGEYAMLKAAAEKGWLDGEAAMMESLLSIN
jgi:porphobilinogen synthase